MWELLLPQGQAATVLWSFDLSMSLTWVRVGPCQPRGHTKAPIVAPARPRGEQEEPHWALTAALSSHSGLRFPPPAEPFACKGQVFMSHGHSFRLPRCAWSQDHAQSVRGQEAEPQQPDPCLKWRMEGGDGAGRAAPAVSIPCSSSSWAKAGSVLWDLTLDKDVTGQRGMASHCQKAGTEGILGSSVERPWHREEFLSYI